MSITIIFCIISANGVSVLNIFVMIQFSFFRKHFHIVKTTKCRYNELFAIRISFLNF